MWAEIGVWGALDLVNGVVSLFLLIKKKKKINIFITLWHFHQKNKCLSCE